MKRAIILLVGLLCFITSTQAQESCNGCTYTIKDCEITYNKNPKSLQYLDCLTAYEVRGKFVELKLKSGTTVTLNKDYHNPNFSTMQSFVDYINSQNCNTSTDSVYVLNPVELPDTLQVTGTVSVDNFLDSVQVFGNISILDSVRVFGGVDINNFPDTVYTSGVSTVLNFPDSSKVYGNITVDNFPDTLNVNVNNFPDTVNVSVFDTVNISGLVTVIGQDTSSIDYTELLDSIITLLQPDTTTTDPVVPVWHEENGLADGSVLNLTNCQSVSLQWGQEDTTGTASGGFVLVTNTRTSKVSKYTRSSGLAPSWNSQSGFIEDLTIDATNAVGLYYLTQGCDVQPYDCIEAPTCEDSQPITCKGWATPFGLCWLTPSAQEWALP